MGMKVTDNQGLFCVEIDGASLTGTYQSYIPKVDDFVAVRSLDRFNMVDTLYSTQGYNAKFGFDNSYEYLDEMLSIKASHFENFVLPSRDLFGFCDNFKAPSFLKNVDANIEGSCVQSLTNIADSVETFLNPVWFFDRKYLKGSSTGSRSADFNGAAVKIFKKTSATGQITQ